MKKLAGLITGLVTTLCSPFYAQGMTDMMKQQMAQQLQASCQDRQFLSCTGISRSKCLSATSEAIKNCDHLFPKNDAEMGDDSRFMQHGQCMETSLEKYSGISMDKTDRCSQGRSASGTPTIPPMNMNQSIEMLTTALQRHAKAVGTSSISLPIYQNATLMSHFTDGQQLNMYTDSGITPLPAAVFASSDDAKTIADYYRRQLNGFKEYRLGKDILFMEKGPAKFDMLRDMKLYMTTPHIMISQAGDVPGTPPGTKYTIEISYRK